MFILAMAAFAASCTPESLPSDELQNNEQDIDKAKIVIPPSG